jgi:hypothetical protein
MNKNDFSLFHSVGLSVAMSAVQASGQASKQDDIKFFKIS